MSPRAQRGYRLSETPSARRTHPFRIRRTARNLNYFHVQSVSPGSCFPATSGKMGGTRCRSARGTYYSGEQVAMPHLVVLKGSDPGLRLALDQARVVLGREPGCDIVLDEEAVSRRHAILSQDGDKYYIEDGDGTGRKSR